MRIKLESYLRLIAGRHADSATALRAVIADYGDGWVEVDRRHPDYPRNQIAFVFNRGPGAELKKLLSRIGITATPNCACNARAAAMDINEAREPGWCEAHLEEIVGWLREEAQKRGLPFVDMAGRLLVRRAIKDAKRNA